MALQIFIFHGVLFAILALIFHVGGDRAILAGSKNSGIKNMAKFNRWAGNRLLLLPVITFVIAQFSMGSPGAKLFGFTLLWIAIISVLVWICSGAKKF